MNLGGPWDTWADTPGERLGMWPKVQESALKLG